MNQEKIKSILAAIQSAESVFLDDAPHVGFTISDVTGEPDNEVLMLYWHDDEGLEYSVKFTEEGLSAASIDGNSISANDHEGNDSLISLYDLTPKAIHPQ